MVRCLETTGEVYCLDLVGDTVSSEADEFLIEVASFGEVDENELSV